MREQDADSRKSICVEICDHQSAFELDCQRLRDIAVVARRLCLDRPAREDAPLTHLTMIEISLVDDAAIARVHGEFMHLPDPTDVITFDHGEILVSTETADVQRKEHGNALDREVALYIVHGLLHLAGYDDRNPDEFQQMVALQNSVLDKAWPA